MNEIASNVLYAPDATIGQTEVSRLVHSGVRFTYSKPADPAWKKAIIQGIEMLTGKPRLERLYRDWSAGRPSAADHIFGAGLRLMNVRLDVNAGALGRAPKTGPLLIVANHPFGVVDGLAIMELALRFRPDVKIMVHSLLCQPPEAGRYLLPVDFSGSAQAKVTSAETRRRAVEWLGDGHCLVVFPAGSVATAQNPLFGPAVDAAWHSFVGRLSKVQAVRVLPVFFHGQNSRLFQLASHLHYALRVALLFRESARHMGRSIKITVGEVLQGSDLPHAEGREAVTAELRRKTFSLGNRAHEPAFVWPRHISFD